MRQGFSLTPCRLLLMLRPVGLALRGRPSPSGRGTLTPAKSTRVILPLVRGKAAEGGRGSIGPTFVQNRLPQKRIVLPLWTQGTSSAERNGGGYAPAALSQPPALQLAASLHQHRGTSQEVNHEARPVEPGLHPYGQRRSLRPIIYLLFPANCRGRWLADHHIRKQRNSRHGGKGNDWFCNLRWRVL